VGVMGDVKSPSRKISTARSIYVDNKNCKKSVVSVSERHKKKLAHYLRENQVSFSDLIYLMLEYHGVEWVERFNFLQNIKQEIDGVKHNKLFLLTQLQAIESLQTEINTMRHEYLKKYKKLQREQQL
jgi:hypothetical protein